MQHKILLIDNYDSFVYNIARYFTQLGCACDVVRNDAITISDIENYHPTHMVISPGPCTPNEAGISLVVVEQYYKKIPILGVCLGHQVIAQMFGASIKRAIKPMHGRASTIIHDDSMLFRGIENPMTVGRYHSLIVAEATLSSEINITARSEEGEVMAISHTTYPLHGVQFHPESVLTVGGYDLLKNFLQPSLF